MMALSATAPRFCPLGIDVLGLDGYDALLGLAETQVTRAPVVLPPTDCVLVRMLTPPARAETPPCRPKVVWPRCRRRL
jgi:hypothetical protein